MFIELGGWWSSVKLQDVCRFFQWPRWREVELLDSRLRLLAQERDDAIQLVETKNVCRAAGELNDEPAENEISRLIFRPEREPYDAVQRIFRNPHQMGATEL